MYTSQKFIEEALGAALRQGVSNITRTARIYRKDPRRGANVIKKSVTKTKDAGAARLRTLQTNAKIQKEKIRADMLTKKANISQKVADIKPKVSKFVAQKKLDSANTIRAGIDRLRAQKTDVQTRGRNAINRITKSVDTLTAASKAKKTIQ
ncbi:MAG: hypothetical protein KAS32_15830 [Candidatus Peribacteraceae bacterium]|nr:hypothetical protein [Candidatus Peribacteraceae bacterium]